MSGCTLDLHFNHIVLKIIGRKENEVDKNLRLTIKSQTLLLVYCGVETAKHPVLRMGETILLKNAR